MEEARSSGAQIEFNRLAKITLHETRRTHFGPASSRSDASASNDWISYRRAGRKKKLNARRLVP